MKSKRVRARKRPRDGEDGFQHSPNSRGNFVALLARPGQGLSQQVAPASATSIDKSLVQVIEWAQSVLATLQGMDWHQVRSVSSDSARKDNFSFLDGI